MPQNLKTLLTQSFAPKITNIAAGSATAVLPAGGQTVTVTGIGFQANATVYINNTSIAATVANTSSLTFTSTAQSAGAYQLSVYNSDGSVAFKPGGLVYFDAPVWTTPAGALPGGSPSTAYTTTVVATGGTITYSVVAGSLPTGLALNSSTGVISGTPTTDSTFNFTIAATNQYNQSTNRAFSISIVSQILIDYLIVAGGGSGGKGQSGGGGAGGMLTGSNVAYAYGTYNITVGAGGAGVTVTDDRGNNGSDSIFGSITAIGGGGGGTYGNGPGKNGGSGGGAGSTSPGPASGGTGTAGQGNNGGSVGTYGVPTYRAGGGGGKSQAGGTSTDRDGAGGNGEASSITGSSVTYAGGGGGGTYGASTTPGGTGGGGTGGGNGGGQTSGTANTGGGGGGTTYPGGTSGAGGSGIVVVRFLDSYPAATTTGSPTYTVSGGYRIYTFTGNGSITF